MTDSISIQGLDASNPTPGLFIQVQLPSGVASGSGSAKEMVLVGNMLSSGSATPDTVVYGPSTAAPLSGELDAIALFGAGSELHRMFRAVVKSNQVSSVSAIAVSESSGSKASYTFTLSGTATASGAIRVWVCGESVDVGFVSGDGYASVGDAAVLAINARTDFPLTAAHSTGSASLVLTAKQKGLRGNWIRVGAQAIPTTAGVSITGGSFAYLSGGTTADSNAAALATLSTQRFYYQVSAAEDASQLGAHSAQITTLASANNGNRQRVFAGSVDSISNAITIATGINSVRAEIAWLAQCDVPPSELASIHAALYAANEAQAVPLMNFNGLPLPFKAPLSGASPSKAQVKSALNNGLTPVNVLQSRACSISRRITTYSLNGAVQDYRTRDACITSICDFFSDDLGAVLASLMLGKNIASDPVDPNVSVPRNCLAPRQVKAESNKLVRSYGDSGLVGDVGSIIASTVCIRESNPSTRISIMVPLAVAGIVNQIGVLVNGS